VVDAAAPQPIRHLLVGDELRHGFLPHAPGDPYDRLHDELIDGICAKATNEVAIDLEKVEGEMLQIKERAETRAEIIKCEAATSTSQFGRESLRVIDVANRGR